MPELDRSDSRFDLIVELFRNHADAVYNVAYRIVWNRSDAEDVVQATFIQVFLKVDQLRDWSRARGWLLQIAYRQALSILRRRKEEPTDPADLAAYITAEQRTSEDAVSNQILRGELADTIRDAINALPQSLRMAIVLRDVEGLTLAEVADVLDIGPSATKMRVTRGRQQLRADLVGKI